MHGEKATLHDIVLQEQPDAVDLKCYEQMPPQEEERPGTVTYPYRVATDCGICKRTVRCVVLAEEGDVRTFQELLCGNFCFVCQSCAKRHQFNYGG
nr:MAG: E7 protein [Leptonychotes weddellii papillomavirus 9]